ncbi:hypothetical protein CVU76_00990 [Candidatus Dojkabacteria bacterium HGW-Dojkabacteria-1]|uniref:Uncharacterized protein n=1 Tax=Candidatus Dojkabacteria bacterium HGW-Dojkabacteria-1 TaxID=2013761 RepID=A0A2N2F346_9BACT|nr:MAG: hypothetical protein CVU76_00990 [Candidatus Dojkabacteria bacterium HGW-Dojkabacteria-1]
MNIVTNLWYGWSTFEKTQEGILLFGILLISLIAIYLISKETRFLLLSSIGFSISAVLNVIGLYLASVLLDIQITEVFRLVPILTSILLISNLGILIGYYVHKRHKKGFSIENIRLEYFMDTSKQTIFLILLGSSIFLFVSIQTQVILVISILSCVGSIWSIYWFSKHLLK